MAETKPSVLDAPFPDHPPAPRERCNSAIALGQQVSSGVELGATPEAPSSAEANEAIEAIRNAGQGVVVLGLAVILVMFRNRETVRADEIGLLRS